MTMTTAPVLEGHDGVVPESDPAARPRRRMFTAAYKSEILDRYDALPKGSSERGALPRSQIVVSAGLSCRVAYPRHITRWSLQGRMPRGESLTSSIKHLVDGPVLSHGK